MAESEEELESLLMKVKEEGEKAGLKLNIQITKIVASGPFSSVQLVTSDSLRPHAACQASLSITNSRSLPKLMSIKLVMPSSHLILCHPLLLLPPISPSMRYFQSVNSSYEVAKVLEFQL